MCSAMLSVVHCPLVAISMKLCFFGLVLPKTVSACALHYSGFLNDFPVT